MTQTTKQKQPVQKLTTIPHIVGLAPATYQRGFGQEVDSSVKYKIIQLIASVRTVMRGKFRNPLFPP
jgi:hypothetical protein